MTIVIVAGGIDLTVGSSMSVITVFIMLLIKEWSFPPALACIVGILIAVTIGFINGIVITFTNMTPFICTLAFMQILQGTAYTLSGGLPIFGLSDNMRFIGQGYIFNLIPVPVIIMLVVFVLACLLMMRTYIGRYFYAVGSNSEAARLSGLNINRIKIFSYMICGLFVGIASIVMMCRISSGQPNAGQGMEMDVITACVVGGISLAGGTGKMVTVILGVLVMGVISNGLGIMGVSTYNQYIAKGILLLFVVGVDSYRNAHQRIRMADVTSAKE